MHNFFATRFYLRKIVTFRLKTFFTSLDAIVVLYHEEITFLVPIIYITFTTFLMVSDKVERKKEKGVECK